MVPKTVARVVSKKTARTKKNAHPPPRSRQAPQQLRIIGGRWRGRRLSFPPIEAIRPSPDRVRETLFNWLQSPVVGATCLDLYAGSGALGLEALSRGAAQVSFVDREARVGRHLKETLDHLGCAQASVHVAQAQQFLEGPPRAFDIVFLDPPFASDTLPRIGEQLAKGWLAPRAWVYIECPADMPPAFPPSWQLHRAGRAGQVGYHLLRTGLVPDAIEVSP